MASQQLYDVNQQAQQTHFADYLASSVTDQTANSFEQHQHQHHHRHQHLNHQQPQHLLHQHPHHHQHHLAPHQQPQHPLAPQTMAQHTVAEHHLQVATRAPTQQSNKVLDAPALNKPSQQQTLCHQQQPSLIRDQPPPTPISQPTQVSADNNLQQQPSSAKSGGNDNQVDGTLQQNANNNEQQQQPAKATNTS